MKKIIIIAALIFSAGILNAAPGRGGYLGHRIIVNAELAYSPFFTSIEDFVTRYNFQYGANVGVIVGRRSQLNVNYNMWQLSGNQRYSAGFGEKDRVKGYGIGLELRTFRKAKGGIAPIGKFFDVGVSYAQNKTLISADNPEAVLGNINAVNLESTQLLVHVGLGTQMVFWDRVIANTGIRAGTPIAEISVTPANSPYSEFLVSRMRSKEIFSVFFGIGILL